MQHKPLRLHAFFHVHFEGLGLIADWISEQNHTLTETHFYKNELPPAIAEIDGLIIMGGPMSVHDTQEFPWLQAENDFVQQCIQAQKPILGICLGAQCIAKALGARVYKNHCAEIGWFEVNRTISQASNTAGIFPNQFTTYHWHGETFDIPQGATLLASSQACTNQAFIYNAGTAKIIGLQFHLEMSSQTIATMHQYGAEDLQKVGPYIQATRDLKLEELHIPTNQLLLYSLLKTLFE